MNWNRLLTQGADIFSRGQIQGLIQKKLMEPDVLAQICDLDRLLEKPETKIYLRSRNLVAAIQLDLPTGTMSVVVKCFPKPNFIRQIIYSYLVLSKAARSWRIAHYLLEHGIMTPKPLAVLHRTGRLLDKTYYLSEDIEEAQTLREWRWDVKRSSGEREQDLASLADYVRRLHSSGVYHKDLTVGNFLMRWDQSGSCEIFLVDLNRARIRKKVFLSRRLKDLARLKVCNCPTEEQGVKFWRLGCGLTTPCEKQRFLKLYFEKEERFNRYKRVCWYYQVMTLAGFRFRKRFKRIRSTMLCFLKGP